MLMLKKIMIAFINLPKKYLKALVMATNNYNKTDFKIR